MKPIAVLGRSGQVARAMVAAAAARGIPLVARGRPEVDVACRASLAGFIEDVQPRLLVNAAAYTAVDKAESEPEAAFRANAEGPRQMAEICSDAGIPLVHLSTDYVFSGQSNRPYREDDPVAPASVYGASKAEGEAAIRRALARHLIIRTSWVYDAKGQNFLRTMLRLATLREEIGVVDDQTGSPTFAQDIAGAILDMVAGLDVQSDEERRWGTYHMTSAGTTSWAGFARAIFAAAPPRGFKAASVRSITSAEYPTPARRPSYSVLDNSRITAAFGIRMPPWQDGLERCLAGMSPPEAAAAIDRP